MYCIHCGADGAAKFCGSCGQRQERVLPFVLPSSAMRADSDCVVSIDDVAIDDVSIEATAIDVDEHGLDWTQSIDYERILQHEHVRARIAAASRTVGPGVTGDDILEIFDAVSPVGFSLGKFAKAILPVYDKLGIKTNHQARCIYDTTSGRLMLATLCTIASHSLVIDHVNQAPTQCSLDLEIPTGLITNKGKLGILIGRFESYCQITLQTSISGQWYDWGKSNRLMTSILAGIMTDLTHQQGGRVPQFRRVA